MKAEHTPLAAPSPAEEPAHGPPLTIVTCSNRADRVVAGARRVTAAAGPHDHAVVVWDERPDRLTSDARQILAELGVVVIDNGRNTGLSHSRNVALDRRATDHLVFVDDDVEMPAATVEALRAAFADGATVVGCRITARFPRSLPWWISEGQIHYLAVHPRRSLPVIWGACFAFDARTATRQGLTFDPRLGRTGRRLESGDDTTFLASLTSEGGRATFLERESVTHVIDEDRLSFAYIARRAFWQGRSEFRRSNSVAGFRKEATRALHQDVAAPRRFALAGVYLGLVGIGIAFEAFRWATSPGSRRAVSS